jgi:TRAP-type C4-dicarboxylate transport system permease small subunit
VESRLDVFLRRLLQVETVCSVLILSVLIAIISAQVFLRYVFNNPFTWAEELGALLLIYLSFVTGDVVYKHNAHISIDYVVGFFPPRLRAVTEIALACMICACLVTLAGVSVPLIHDQFGYTIAAALPLSKSWWTMPVPIVFASMILTTVNVIIHRVGALRG